MTNVARNAGDLVLHLGAADQVPGLVRRLYEVVAELERLFPGRKFTLDGHLVGSIGEVLAAHHYGLTLLGASAVSHDAVAPDGRHVQVKATQAKSVGLRSEPAHLLVLRLAEDGSVSEAFNGPGSIAWEHSGPMQSNGQRSITVSKLRRLMDTISTAERLPLRVRMPADSG